MHLKNIDVTTRIATTQIHMGRTVIVAVEFAVELVDVLLQLDVADAAQEVVGVVHALLVHHLVLAGQNRLAALWADAVLVYIEMYRKPYEYRQRFIRASSDSIYRSA